MKTVEMEEQKHQKRKQPRTKPKKQVLYGVILYGIAESFSDNFAAVGNHHKRLGLYFFDIVSQLHSLASFQQYHATEYIQFSNHSSLQHLYNGSAS